MFKNKGIQKLRNKYLWPIERPAEEATGVHGWLNKENEQWLERLCAEKMGHVERPFIFCELGVWEGKTALHLLKKFPSMYYIGIDHFKGSPEHQTNAEWKTHLPKLKEKAFAHLWPWKDRATLITQSTNWGICEIVLAGIKPDIFYIDAGHETTDVMQDFLFSYKANERAIVCGDDAKWPSVHKALTILELNGYKFLKDGNFWVLQEYSKI